MGWVSLDDVDSWYSSADALVVSSRWEGLPLVIPESLRNGTPVIISRRSGMQELISEGVSGVSFDLSVRELTKVLLSLQKEELNMMRSACRDLYESRYSMDRLFSELYGQYSGIYMKRRRGNRSDDAEKSTSGMDA